jgi:hypothetical protein
MHLSNTTRISYYYKGVLFYVDCPLGTPIPRVDEYVIHPTTGQTYKVKRVEYRYPTDIPGIVNHMTIVLESV